MGAVAVPATVTNAATKAPINGLSAINFEGLVAAPGQTGQPVTPQGNGQYVLAFDDTQTSRITCNVFGFLPESVTYTNQKSLSFAMPPEQGFTVQFQLTSGGPFTAPANVQVFIDTIGAVLPLRSGSISWGDGASSNVDVTSINEGSAGTNASHIYGLGGSFTLTCTITDSRGVTASASTGVTIAAPARPIPTPPPPIAWGASLQYDTGGPNAVALDNNGNVVEVHVGSNKLYSRVGKANFANQTIAWGASFQYDIGGPDAVALDNNGNVVEVHVGGSELYYHVGKANFANQTIAWGASFPYDSGGPNAVALDNNGDVVEVHVGSGSNELHYHVGKLGV
jgi:hypothetical protein